MPMIGIEKLTIDVLLGGVSEIVTLSFELPPPQFVVQALCSPLQEFSANVIVVATTSNRRDFRKFISRTPRQD
jgi:hypothetical protein